MKTRWLSCLFLICAFAPRGSWAVAGDPDFAHENVGAVLVPMPVPGAPAPIYFTFCSGTLIHERAFLTDAGSMDFLEFLIAIQAITMDDIYITFDQLPAFPVFMGDPVPPTWLSVQDIVINPGWPPRPGHENEISRLAVAVLEDPVAGIEPARLPSSEIFCQGDNRYLKQQDYTVSGYGGVVEFPPPQAYPPSGRRLAKPHYLNAVMRYAIFQQNPAAGYGGGGPGNAGAPVFIVEPDNKETLVATLYGGPHEFISTVWCNRVDIPEALDFIDAVLSSLDP